MRAFFDFLKILGAAAGCLFTLGLVGFGLSVAGLAPALPVLLFLAFGAAWVLYTYLRYRVVRQDELLAVLATAAEAQLPLGPALRAYLRDRPRESEGGVLEALLVMAFFPVHWLWHQRASFDRRAADVAARLDAGEALPDALRNVPGAASREGLVAAAVGETTGRLAAALRRADRERLANAWLEIVPRLVYPLLLVLFIVGITTFVMMMIMPRFARIFRDFNEPLPEVTQRLVAFAGTVDDYAFLVVVLAPAALVLAAFLTASPWARWYLPLFGRLYRWEVQGMVLRMLGALLEAGRPVPEALRLLTRAGDFPGVARRRLSGARRRVERGEPLADALRRAGLLPRAMAGLVRTAERVGTLPWALAELGELLSTRAVRLARRTSLIVSPLLIAAVGALVGFIVLGIFAPLIQLLSRLSE